MTGIRLLTNCSSLRTQRSLARIGDELRGSANRLASGLRINKASDDAAGLAISSNLENDRRILTRGIANINDGISLLSIADAALETLSTTVMRLRELAEQAANGALSAKQRNALNKEAQFLSEEFTRTIRTTSFNGLELFDSSFGSLRLQGGIGSDGTIDSQLGGAVGTGYFNGAIISATSQQSTAVEAADVNGDGHLDIIGNRGVYVGAGNGTFLLTQSFNSWGAIQTGDLNNDGYIDLISGGGALRFGRGDGTFGPAVTNLIQSGDWGTALADLNQDGNLDIVALGDDGLEVTLGKGDGTFGPASTADVSVEFSPSFALGDLDRDGVLDIITSGYLGNGGYGGYGGYAGYGGWVRRVEVHLGNRDGTFKAGQSADVEWIDEGEVERACGSSPTLADFDRDGVLDLVLSHYSGLMVLGGNGNGTFKAGSIMDTGPYIAITRAVDMNGDGWKDIVAGNNSLWVLMNDRKGGFIAPSGTASPAWLGLSFALGDVNEDGVPDVVAAGFGSSIVTHTAQTTTGCMPLLDFSLGTRAGALQAYSVLKSKSVQLSKQRAQLGAAESRLASALNALSAATLEYAAAGSRITDVDVATEAASYVRLQILKQASASILAHANQQPSLALQLLSTGIPPPK